MPGVHISLAPPSWALRLAARLPRTASDVLRLHARLLAFTRHPGAALVLLIGALLVGILAVVLGEPRPPRFGALDAAFASALEIGSALLGLGAGLAARLRWTRSLAESWAGWLLTPRQRAIENAVAAGLAMAGWVATVGLFGLLAYKGGLLPLQVVVALAGILMAGFAVGALFAFRSRQVLARLAAGCIRLLSRQPWLALQAPNPARIVLSSLPAVVASTTLAFGVAAVGRLEAFLSCVIFTAMLGTMALAELRPATPTLKALVGWSGPAALGRLAPRLAVTHAFVLLALCSPLLAVGLVEWPTWGFLCIAVLAMAAWYSALIRQVAALRPTVNGVVFVMAHFSVGLTLLATLPLGGWLIPWHIRWLLRKGHDDWLS